jgi:hypothetical protein
MPAGQLHRRLTVFGRPRKRVKELGARLVGKAGERKERAPDPMRHRTALFQMPDRVAELRRPVLGGAETDQCERVQVLAQVGMGRVRGLGHDLQPLCLFGHRRQVPTLAA